MAKRKSDGTQAVTCPKGHDVEIMVPAHPAEPAMVHVVGEGLVEQATYVRCSHLVDTGSGVEVCGAEFALE